MKFKILFLLATGLMANTYANTSINCAQGNAKFLEVARDYNACNSITGGDQNACVRFCEDSDALLSSGSQQGGSCDPAQIRGLQDQARQQGMNAGKQQGRDEVIRDLSVREDFISNDYYGANEDDCGRRASQASQGLRLEAMKRCNDKAITIKNCYIESEKVTGTYGRPAKFEGNFNFRREDNRSTEEECRRTATAEASKQALKKCLDSTGHDCTITATESIITHRTQAPSGLRLGRRDDRICDAKVFAEAPRDLTYKCNMRMSAKNRIN